MKAAIVSMGAVSTGMLKEALEKYYDKVDHLDIRNVEITFSGSKAEILYEGKPFGEYDCIYARSSFRYANLLESLTVLQQEKSYMPIVSSAFTIAHDKLLTQLELQKHKIPMPKTYMASTTEAARSLLERLNYPMIMKFPHGTQGKGVLFADSFQSASSILDALSYLRQPFIMQEFINTGGEDIRAFVVGEKVVAAYKRKASVKEFRANLHAGGAGEATFLDEETKRIAVKAAKALGAQICGVDILVSHKGPLVIEVNVSPSLKGITQYSGIDVSDKVAKFLFEQNTKKKDIEQGQTANKILAAIDNIEETSEEKSIIMGPDFRGARLLLPEMITKVAKISESHDYEFTAKRDEITIKKFDVK
jgi:ribosomal protein S6--L-glutamate ligase